MTLVSHARPADALRSADRTAAFLQASADAVSAPGRARIDASPGASLSARQRAPVAAILAEAVGNAVRYAYAGDPQGKIWVNLSVERGHMRLSIRDSGPGLPELSDRACPGFERIRAAAAGLGGYCRIDNRNYGGAEVTVVFPTE